MAANTLIFLIAWALSKYQTLIPEIAYSALNHSIESRPDGEADSMVFANTASFQIGRVLSFQPINLVLPLIALSGSVSFLYEVLWTRLLNHIFGGTVYAYSVMLATFLTGIALGAAASSKFAANRDRAALSFAGAQFAIAIFAAITYALVERMLPGTYSLARMQCLPSP